MSQTTEPEAFVQEIIQEAKEEAKEPKPPVIDYEAWKNVDIEKVIRYKEEGNQFFKIGKYEDAEKKYRSALLVCAPNAPNIEVTNGVTFEDITDQDEEEEKKKKEKERQEKIRKRNESLSAKDATIIYEGDEDVDTIPPQFKELQTVLYSNLAAVYLQFRSFQRCITEATNAIRRDPKHLKALLRRASAYEELTKYEEAVQDLKTLKEVNPSSERITKDLERVEKLRQEQQKVEMDKMLGQLKDLGNTILGKFGMSLDQFNFQKDEKTGSYTLNTGGKK
ncbi:tetratricopeptide repeat protein [Acrasis kona]|uniref:Tetratricopeptide repeat protein n=1 Tax=Acrasis kona TaxID=1008807 RepID=A0AAW2YL19_9EUKA